jgi:hypothetical protein
VGRRVQFTDLTTFGFLNGEFGHVVSRNSGSNNREAFFTVLVDSPRKELGYPDSLECSPSVFRVVEQVPTPVTAPVTRRSRHAQRRPRKAPSSAPPASAVSLCPQEEEEGGGRSAREDGFIRTVICRCCTVFVVALTFCAQPSRTLLGTSNDIHTDRDVSRERERRGGT